MILDRAFSAHFSLLVETNGIRIEKLDLILENDCVIENTMDLHNINIFQLMQFVVHIASFRRFEIKMEIRWFRLNRGSFGNNIKSTIFNINKTRTKKGLTPYHSIIVPFFLLGKIEILAKSKKKKTHSRVEEEDERTKRWSRQIDRYPSILVWQVSVQVLITHGRARENVRLY